MQMLAAARKKREKASEVLSEGICTKDMYNKSERGERILDRMKIKRLLARLGVDNGSYENYLEYADYIVWKVRMEIINSIERHELVKAEELLNNYYSCDVDGRSKNNDNIPKQFLIFMKLQIIRHKSGAEYKIKAFEMYEEALKQTVPNIDSKSINNLLLSPLELVLAVEYKRRKNHYTSVEELFGLYEEFFEYIEKTTYGKLSLAKVYPKLVACLYEDICNRHLLNTIADNREMCEKLLFYCDKAISISKERKEMFYLIEMLEINIQLKQFLKAYINDISRIKEQEASIKKATLQRDTLMKLYEEYGIYAHMRDDCFLYRESGIYCIPNVIKIRREMMHLTQKALCEGICDIKTLSREEKGQVAIQKYTFTQLFKRLGLYPDYINMGIVTEEKEAVELYEELRYATNSFRYDDVDKLILKLKKKLEENKHAINEQVIISIDNRNKWLTRRISFDKYIEILHKALEKTIKIEDIIESKGEIVLSIRELTLVYQISLAYKESGQYDKAYSYIEKIWDYCKKMEEEGLEDGRIGTYEMIMSYLSSLLGDMGRFEEANAIVDKLIALSLRLRRSVKIHQSIYDKAWNNNECKKKDFDYKCQLETCICISQLIGDTNDELFYKDEVAKL